MFHEFSYYLHSRSLTARLFFDFMIGNFLREYHFSDYMVPTGLSQLLIPLMKRILTMGIMGISTPTQKGWWVYPLGVYPWEFRTSPIGRVGSIIGTSQKHYPEGRTHHWRSKIRLLHSLVLTMDFFLWGFFFEKCPRGLSRKSILVDFRKCMELRHHVHFEIIY